LKGDCDTSTSCTEKLKALAHEVGLTVGKMHDAGIIHGDLTTSNILINLSASDGKPVLSLIDFGLSHVDNSPEDKGVDLYVLERALTSTHSNIPWFFEIVLEAYKTTNLRDGKEVGVKLDEIRLRGRKRTMVG
jgi:TP53 regulating kinase-like protein